MNPIRPISAPLTFQNQEVAKSLSATQGPAFKDYLLSSIEQVNSMQQAADQAVEELAVGGEVNSAEVLTAVQKADIAFRMMIQIRNKIVQAYQEVQNMRV